MGACIPWDVPDMHTFPPLHTQAHTPAADAQDVCTRACPHILDLYTSAPPCISTLSHLRVHLHTNAVPDEEEGLHWSRRGSSGRPAHGSLKWQAIPVQPCYLWEGKLRLREE